MYLDTYKSVARIKAWKDVKNITFSDLVNKGISLEQFDEFINEWFDGEVRDPGFVYRVADAMAMPYSYLERGTSPIELSWKQRRMLKTFERLHEFYSRARRWERFTPNYLSRFVKDEQQRVRHALEPAGFAAFQSDLPDSVEDVICRFKEWNKSAHQ